MMAECCESPLKKRFSFLTRKYLLKSFANLSHPLPDAFSLLWNKVQYKNNLKIKGTFVLINAFVHVKDLKHQIKKFSRHPLYDFPSKNHLFSPKINFQNGKTIQNIPNPDLLFNDLTSQQFPDHSLFFTDGSKTDGAAGCASICPSKGLFIRHKIVNHASIFSIEARAILYSLDSMIRQEGKWIAAVIFTDSQGKVSL